MIDDLIEYLLDVLYKGTKHLKAERKLQKLQNMYKGWNLKTNLLVGRDQFLQKPFEIKFLNEG